MKRLLQLLVIIILPVTLFAQSRTPVYEGVNATTSEYVTNSLFPGYTISSYRGYYDFSIFDCENSKYPCTIPDGWDNYEWKVRIEYIQKYALFFDYNNDGNLDYLMHMVDLSRNQVKDVACGGSAGPGLLKLYDNISNKNNYKSYESPYHLMGYMALNDFNGDGIYNEVLMTSEDGHGGTSCEMLEQPNTHKLLFFNNQGIEKIDNIGPNITAPGHGLPATGDIDNDGDVDIISVPWDYMMTSNNNEEIPYFLINDGNGNFTQHNEYFKDQQKLQDELISFRCMNQILFDINKDGNLDYLISTKPIPRSEQIGVEKPYITIFWGDGTGHYELEKSSEIKLSEHETGLLKGVVKILPNDYDNDGDFDIFVVSTLNYSGTVIDLYENNDLEFTDVAPKKFDVNSHYRGNTTGIWERRGEMRDFYSLFLYDYEGDGDFDLYPSGFTNTGIPDGYMTGYEFWENVDGHYYYRKDTDRDGIVDEYDNCPTIANKNQKDTDGDGLGDVCEGESDVDLDGIKYYEDNSPNDYNPFQEDLDKDGIGDISDSDMIILSITERTDQLNYEQQNFSLEEKIHQNIIRSEQFKFNYYNENELKASFKPKEVAGGIQIEITENIYSKAFRGGTSLVYSPGGDESLFLNHLENKYVDLNLTFYHGYPEVKENKILRVYIDQYKDKTKVNEESKQESTNIIKHSLKNPYKYDFIESEGDINTYWSGPSFESHIIPFDFNNDFGKTDLLIGDFRINYKGRNLNINQISEPVYLLNKGDNTFESSSNYYDDPNLEPYKQKINQTVFHNPQMYELSDLNGDGIDEIINFGEHYHFDGHQHLSKIKELMHEKYGLDEEVDYNEWGFKKHRYYSLNNTHDGRYQLFDKVSNIIEPEGQEDVFLSSYGNTVGDIDNDGDIDVVVASQTNSMGYVFDVLINDGNGILTVNRTVENEVITSEGKMLLYDINNDGFKDLIFGGQEEATKTDRSVFGYFLNNGNGNFIYDFKEIGTFHPSLGLRNIYVSEIDSSTNQIIAYFSTGFGSNGGGTTLKDIPNLIKIYNVNKETSEFTDVTSTYFSSNQNEMNYYTQTGWVKYLDLDGDGNKDIVPKFHLEDPDSGWNYEGNAFRGNWNNSDGFQYFRYNPTTKRFDLINLGKLSDDKFYNDYDFVDVYNDSKPEWITFDKNPGGTGDLTIFEFDYKSDDLDNDGILNNVDNCPNTYNPDQKDTDGDGIGDVCDDSDGDGVFDNIDNCNSVPNPNQEDADSDGIGDVCEDNDNDGVFDLVDQCPNTTEGSLVDTNGCEVFNLPSNNYSIEVTSATCIGSTNGAVTISAQNRTYTYNVILTGQSTLTLSSTNSHTVDLNNLATGNYELCFTVEGQDSYRQCFSVQVGEPAPLSASSKVDYGNKSVSLSMDGSEIYNIRLNGNEFTTKSSEITLDLKPGMNYLEVTTDLSCQGTYFKEIFVSEEVIVYPNPTEDWVQIYVGGLDTKVNVTLRELKGVISYTQEMEVPDNRVLELDLTGKYPGIYFIGLQSKTVQSNLKVIKK